MSPWDLFGKAKKTVKKGSRDVKRAEEYASTVYDREIKGGMEAHRRGADAVGERFGRANAAVGDYAERSFGFSEDSEFASGMMGDGVDLAVSGRDEPDRNDVNLGLMGGPQSQSVGVADDMMDMDYEDDDMKMGMFDPIGSDNNDDRLW